MSVWQIKVFISVRRSTKHGSKVIIALILSIASEIALLFSISTIYLLNSGFDRVVKAFRRLAKTLRFGMNFLSAPTKPKNICAFLGDATRGQLIIEHMCILANVPLCDQPCILQIWFRFSQKHISNCLT
jgi:hypothetical protein